MVCGSAQRSFEFFDRQPTSLIVHCVGEHTFEVRSPEVSTSKATKGLSTGKRRARNTGSHFILVKVGGCKLDGCDKFRVPFVSSNLKLASGTAVPATGESNVEELSLLEIPRQGGNL
jgi:hypothetical protein